jgi:hypothetical protein
MLDKASNIEALNVVLDELDINSRSQHTGDKSEEYWVCQRRNPRHPFRTDCTLRFFLQGSSRVAELPGRTRNLSRGGLGLLARRVFQLGEAVEVQINVPGRPMSYMAGICTFCRYAGRGFHEVGIQLRAAGSEPVFSAEPSLAVEKLDWLRHAVIPAAP